MLRGHVRPGAIPAVLVGSEHAEAHAKVSARLEQEQQGEAEGAKRC